MSSPVQNIDARVLIVAPSGRDAGSAAEVLRAERIEALECSDIPQLCEEASKGAGVLLVAQEGLAHQSLDCLLSLLDKQPPWSDLPLIVLTTGGDVTNKGAKFLMNLGQRSAVTLLERPLRRSTLVSAIRAALRARGRQCEMRDLMAQREQIVAELRTRTVRLEESQRELLQAKEIISKHAEDLEQTVRERTAKLTETNAQLEAFSYSISHDMRGPLRAMQQYSQILMDEETELKPESRDFLLRISRASTRLDRLIQDVLLYSRAARAEVRLSDVDTEKLIHEIVHQYPGLQEPKAEVRISQPLAPVVAHEASLTQCISNLLSNAVKFVPPGRKPLVSVRTQQHNGTVRLWIEDNGIGIAPKNQERIFNIFERVHSPSQYEGTGIGLAIVKKTVERMGGRVGLESDLGRGTKFWIDLPSPHKA
jgi:signal transduction histidine kinase